MYWTSTWGQNPEMGKHYCFSNYQYEQAQIKHIDFAARKRSKLIHCIKKGLKRLQVSLQKKKTKTKTKKQVVSSANKLSHLNPFYIIIAAK